MAMIETTTANQKGHLEIMIIPVPVDGFGTVIEQNINIIAHTCTQMMNHFKYSSIYNGEYHSPWLIHGLVHYTNVGMIVSNLAIFRNVLFLLVCILCQTVPPSIHPRFCLESNFRKCLYKLF